MLPCNDQQKAATKAAVPGAKKDGKTYFRLGDEENEFLNVRKCNTFTISLLLYGAQKFIFVTHARFSSFFDLKRGPKVTCFDQSDKKILYLPNGR